MKTLAIMLLTIALAGMGCEPSSRQVNVPVARPSNGPMVVFPDGFKIDCELADTDETRQQGLMYRESLAPGKGMIFIFTQAGFYPFWMKNTLIPLDMIWLDGTKKIVSISEKVPPCAADPCPTYPPTGNALYVLEIAGGEAAKHHLKSGDSVVMQHFENFVAR
ncbi:MAG TPA: DUF192 domain-containing protein [Thermoanaerobaculia bacterium]|nr:DUF192 domain-containing protein [Thermoanaerobaculia bacterium]